MAMDVYLNEDRLCECWKCERSYSSGGDCPYDGKLQRHPRDLGQGGLGLCPKLRKPVVDTGMHEADDFSAAAGLLEEGEG